MVRLRNAYANANIKHALSFRRRVTVIVIMAEFMKICNDDDCGDENLMHAHLHLKRK